MELLNALEHLFTIKHELKKARDNYEGYEFGYHHQREIEAVDKAEKDFNKAFDDKVNQAVSNALNK